MWTLSLLVAYSRPRRLQRRSRCAAYARRHRPSSPIIDSRQFARGSLNQSSLLPIWLLTSYNAIRCICSAVFQLGPFSAFVKLSALQARLQHLHHPLSSAPCLRRIWSGSRSFGFHCLHLIEVLFLADSTDYLYVTLLETSSCWQQITR